MRSHNHLLRGVLTFVAILTFCILLTAIFHIKISDGLSITPIQERPFFYEEQPPPPEDPNRSKPPKKTSPKEPFHRRPQHKDDDDKKKDQSNTQDDYYDLRLDRGDDAEDKPYVDYHLLTSLRNNMGFYNKIDARKTGHKLFNPTILELPRDTNITHDFLVIARTTHVAKEINGKKYKVARQVATFANLTTNYLDRPVIRTGEWSTMLLEDFGGPEHHCKRQPDMDKYVGPEDMKLFWTRAGEPLLIFTHQVNDETMCQGQFLIDVRAALPELEQVLGPDFSSRLPSIRFAEPTLLAREPAPGQENHPRYQREKNWALAQSPFSPDSELLMMVEPGQLFRWKSADEPVEPIVAVDDQESAVEEPYPPTAKPGKTWHGKKRKTCIHDVMIDDSHVHQSSPMLSVTICNRGTCEPDEQNTVLMGIVQRRQDFPGASSTWYDRRIAVYESAAPYRMISVGKKLTYHGESDLSYSWTGSMSYYTNQTEFPPSNHGYLDDEVWLGFGVKDAAAGWLDVRAKDLIADHYMCQGASVEYKYYRQGISA
ncbi:hypothetical protein FAGAP_8864 [Fusarium agapanthi]|uniref:Uncharacterized protein n=1 Tax=Fusarium agapanthi TaxID=1803897 RepID=A0A9P5EBH8_9HYPO|nr:hypothetical protein FAGAP_8864 [Fusarium agapanthi]